MLGHLRKDCNDSVVFHFGVSDNIKMPKEALSYA
jgi:hypothetical protein